MGESTARNNQQEKPLRIITGGTDSAESLDKVIHERMRLAILSALAVNQTLTFNELKQLLQTTDGNMSVHGQKLEQAGYIKCRKSFNGRTPKTDYEITAAGRKALEKYLKHMEALIAMVRKE